MDLWLECLTGEYHSLTKNQEYQVVDIDPLKGRVKLINNNDNETWFSEKNFKARKENENMIDKNIINKKLKYNPFIVDFNVNGCKLTANVDYVDSNLPETDSLNKFLGVTAPFGLDIKTRKGCGIISIELTQSNNEIINGIFKTNIEALEYAEKAIKTINYFNDILVRTEYELAQVYIVEFCPGGKRYIFRSNDNLKISDFVICYSSIGKQYAKVVDLDIESQHNYMSRAYCELYKG